MLRQLTRIARARRRGRIAFWHVQANRLTVAVLEPTADEPLLRACATVAANSQAATERIAPGLLEAATSVDALGLVHVAALSEADCRLGRGEPAAGDNPPAATLSVPVAELEGVRVWAPAALVVEVAARFARARLDLRRLDCSTCARVSLAAYLGKPCEGLDDFGRVAALAETDALTAVSVDPRCEADAVGLASELIVPVGLALAQFGLAGCAAA